MEYLEKKGATGYLTFTATMKGDDPVIRTWAAKRKDVEYEINITLYREPGWDHAATVSMEMQNHYEPIEQ